jgi:hypothetical protein
MFIAETVAASDSVVASRSAKSMNSMPQPALAVGTDETSRATDHRGRRPSNPKNLSFR